MISAWLIGSALLTAGPPRETLAPPDLGAYESAKAGVGRDAGSQVRLALWCEAHGLQAERIKHLAIAVMTDPTNATARGLLGLVAYQGRWQRPDAVGEKVKADAAHNAVMAEYNTRREKTEPTAEAQWRLALWCKENGLKAEAQAHLAAVVRLDPAHAAAWKRLGCKKHNGRWMTESQFADERAETEAQKKADKKWRPLLTKWRGWLDTKAKRGEAEEALSEVTDPRAVRAVWSVFAAGEARQQEVAVRVLGQIDAPAASRALALLAVSSPSAEVRRAATETLKRRDPREFAGQLIAMLRDPIKYEVRHVRGPGLPGTLFVKGQPFNVQRLYAPPALPTIPVFPGDSVWYDGNGLPVLHHVTSRFVSTQRITGQQILNWLDSAQPTVPSALSAAVANQLGTANALRLSQAFQAPPSGNVRSMPGDLRNVIQHAQQTEHHSPKNFGFGLNFGVTNDTQIPVGQMVMEAQKAAVVAEAQLRSDVAAVDSFNSEVRDSNTRAAAVLDAATGLSLGDDRKAWEGWWINQLGYAHRTPDETPVPTVVENVPLAYQPPPVPVMTTTMATLVGFHRMSCFGAGTLVRTLEGVQAIETLKVGDQVLTQELKGGGLGYHPILVVHHNPPSPTFLIKLAGETIVSSPFHRFWKAGQGWVMARDLKPGDTLRMLGGLTRVESVDAGPVQPVFNLDVAEDHDFFAGERGALVHDNTLPELRQAPFDRDPPLSAITGVARSGQD